MKSLFILFTILYTLLLSRAEPKGPRIQVGALVRFQHYLIGNHIITNLAEIRAERSADAGFDWMQCTIRESRYGELQILFPEIPAVFENSGAICLQPFPLQQEICQLLGYDNIMLQAGEYQFSRNELGRKQLLVRILAR